MISKLSSNFFLFLGISLLVACTSSSKEIVATEISPSIYKKYDCDALSQELALLIPRMVTEADRLDKEAGEDAGAFFLTYISYGFYKPTIGGNEALESSYASTLGRYDAALMAGSIKKCDLDSNAIQVAKVSAQTSSGDLEEVGSASDTSLYQQTAPVTPDTPIDISGTYRSEITGSGDWSLGRFPNVEVILKQDKGEISGTFSGTRSGEIEGILNGDTIKFKWFVTAGRTESGRGEWKLPNDGITWNGTWRSSRGSLGNWNLTKINHMPDPEMEPGVIKGQLISDLSSVEVKISDIEKIDVQQLNVSNSISSQEGQTLVNTNLSGIYVAGPTSDDTQAFNNSAYRKHILRLHQDGDQITVLDSRNNTITGVLKDGVVYFAGLTSSNKPYGFLSTFGQWTIIKNHSDGLEVNWKARGTHNGGNWNLRKLENSGVELYTVETGFNQSFRIRESEKLFDMIFAPPNNQNVVFYIHGRVEDFEEEFLTSMVPYTEASSNTRFVLIHWLSWGEYRMRPYRQARISATGLSDFLSAFDDYKSRKPGYVGDRNITLLAHSMGNIPLKVFLEEFYEKQELQRGLLDSVLLSSADVPMAGHPKWVEKIDFSDNIHIIQNRRDIVLSLSKFIYKDTPGGQGPKLGRGFDTPTDLNIKDLANNARYLNVSHFAGVGHRPFNMSSYSEDVKATRLFKLLLNGQDFDFPDPSIGLYKKPELIPVFNFYSRDPEIEAMITESELSSEK